MPKAVKMAPNLWQMVRPLEVGDRIPRQYDPGVLPRAWNELRALLAVARAVRRWRDYDGDSDGIMEPLVEADFLRSIIKDSRRLDRLSKGGKT
jgi:hypothetical protein